MAPLPRRLIRPLNALLGRDMPGYEKRPFLDRAYWLDIEPVTEPWISALEAIDARGDKAALLGLLVSDRELPHDARVYLADLLERHQFKRKQGHQATPLYGLSRDDQLLYCAVTEMQLIRDADKSVRVKDALEEVSKRRNIPPEKLLVAYHGRRGSMRRLNKRRPKP